MPEEIDPSFVEALRGLIDVISGARHFFMAIAATTPEPTAAPEDERPEEGAVLIGSALRCIVTDHLDPAIKSLETLIEATLEMSSAEPET